MQNRDSFARWWVTMGTMLALALSFGLGCGDDDGGADAGAPRSGDSCPSAGQAMTGCICAANRPPGSRQCREDLTWSACSCPLPREENGCAYEGQPVRCDPCEGESTGRMTTCGPDRRFDCSCGQGGSNDGGMGTGTPMTDAG
jgi:hypothetical protein